MPFGYLLKLNLFYPYCLKVALWWVVSNTLLEMENLIGNFVALGIVNREQWRKKKNLNKWKE